MNDWLQRCFANYCTDVVPYRFHRPVIFSYAHKHMLKDHGRCLGVAGRYVWLNLEGIAFDRESCCSRQAGIWRKMLFVGFHEFGHIVLGHLKISCSGRYGLRHSIYLEDQTTAKAEEWIAKILANNSRLYQPDFIGIVDIIRRKEQKQFRAKYPNAISWRNIKDARCQATGGQLSVMDVAHKLTKYDKTFRQRIRLIHKFGNNLARIHVDSAGRRHHFWVWGDLSVIAQRLIENNISLKNGTK